MYSSPSLNHRLSCCWPAVFPRCSCEDGVFDSFDVVAALSRGAYAENRHAAIAPNGARDDGQTSIIYDPATGEIAVDAPAARDLTSINIDSTACIFTGDYPLNIGPWDDSDCNIFKATFGSSFGSLSFGNVARMGLSWDFIQNDLTVIGSLAGGGHLGEVDLVYVSPDFTGANFSGRDLTGADFSGLNLTDANFRGADLSGANFRGATLRGAEFTDTIVTGADFGHTTDLGFTARQLYSTKSYQQADVRGIDLSRNDLRGWNFAGQDLTHADLGRSDLSALLEVLPDRSRFTVASFAGANLTGANLADADLSDADFTAANIPGANFAGSYGFTEEQLYSTASYERKNLSGVDLSLHDVSGWNFAGQFLVGAAFREAALAGADFNAAIVNGATFRGTTATGFATEQLYGTTSYLRSDLSGIDIGDNDLSGWNFNGQNLSGATLDHALLADVDFTGAAMSGADLTQAVFSGANFRGARGLVADQLYATASYQDKQLARTGFGELDLTGWSFAEQDLTEATFVDAVLRDAEFSRATISNAILDRASFLNADLSSADLTGASLMATDLTAADLRNAAEFSPGDTTITRNTIWPDGRIERLDLAANDTLVTHDVDQSIVVEDRFVIADAGVLELMLDGKSWGSTVTVRTDAAAPQLGGTLRIGFDASLIVPRVAQLKGSRYDLFDWSGPVDVTNRFDQIELPAHTEWDLSGLYETGEVVLISAIAEPGDTNLDFRFDQIDLVLVQISAKYLTGEPATWEQGDFNGDGVFDPVDLVLALQTGNYLQGPYAAR